MTTKRDCSGKIWSDNPRDVSGRVYKCQRNATVQHDGKWYCWQHDPIRVEADRKRCKATWDAKYDRETAKWERRERNAKLAALVTEELEHLLMQLASMAVLIASETESQYGIDDSLAIRQNKRVDDARAYAARIREALGPEANDEPR